MKPWCVGLKNRNYEIISDLSKKKMESLDIEAETCPLSEDEIQIRDLRVKTLCEIEDNNLEDLKQKAKVKWVVDGDKNSSFFNGVVKGHQKYTRIYGLVFDGGVDLATG
ncbi:hypothetical protein Hdeb2414_s0030g00708181 [Helianthus debilis subsp. tardiflorus]